MKIVQFSNGEYAIRKGNYFTRFQYLDLSAPGIMWWERSSKYFKYCLSPDIEIIKNKKLLIQDYGTPI